MELTKAAPDSGYQGRESSNQQIDVKDSNDTGGWAKDEGHRSATETFSSWAEASSCNGIPHLVGRGSKFRKLCWGALVLTGTVLTIRGVVIGVQEYLSFPINIVVSVDFRSGMSFPAVTICNTNQIRKSALADLQPTLGSVFPEHYGIPSIYNQFSAEGRVRTRERFDQAWALVNNSVKEWAGHQMNKTILNCVYDGKVCSPPNFTLILNPLHGNCFTFNSGASTNILKTYKPGPLNGLTLEIFLDQAEYIPELTDHAGIKVLVHHQEVMPFPEDEGFLIPPGYYTLVNTRQNTIERLAAPYPSKCVHLEAEKASLYTVYSEIVPYADYSLEGCKKTCYQATVISECLCGDPRFPLDGIAVKVLMDPSKKHMKIQPCSTPAEEICEEGVRNKARHNRLKCNCSLPCWDIFYITSESSAEWPIPSVQDMYYGALAQNHPHVAYVLNGTSAFSARSNLLKVSVFFEVLNSEFIKEKKAMTPSRLFSTVGGTFGFYLGLSIVAMFEFGELLIDLSKIFIRKIHKRSRK